MTMETWFRLIRKFIYRSFPNAYLRFILLPKSISPSPFASDVFAFQTCRTRIYSAMTNNVRKNDAALNIIQFGFCNDFLVIKSE